MKRIHTGLVLVALCFASFMGAGIAAYVLRPAEASRNSSGTFSLYTPGNPVVSGTVGSSTWANNTLNDIATSLTDSLDRNGKGGMLAALRGIDGTVTAPAFSWTSETGSGLFRNGTNDVRMSIGGTARQAWSSTGSSVTGTFAVSGASTLTGNVGVGAASAYPLDVQGVVGSANEAVIRALGTAASSRSILVASDANPRIDFNIDSSGVTGTGDRYMQAGFGMDMYNEAASGDLVIRTAPSGSAAAAATLTERLRVGITGLKVNTGMPDGTGVKTHRTSTGCNTAASVGATCNTTITWGGAAWADTLYVAVCTPLNVTSGAPLLQYITNQTTTAMTVVTYAMTAAAAQFTGFNCIAVHP